MDIPLIRFQSCLCWIQVFQRGTIDFLSSKNSCKNKLNMRFIFFQLSIWEAIQPYSRPSAWSIMVHVPPQQIFYKHYPNWISQVNRSVPGFFSKMNVTLKKVENIFLNSWNIENKSSLEKQQLILVKTEWLKKTSYIIETINRLYIAM